MAAPGSDPRPRGSNPGEPRTDDRSELGRFGLQRVDVAERVGAVEFADPYRQLEQESRAVQAWVAHQHERAGAALAQLPGLDRLAQQLTEHLAADGLTAPTPAGGRWLWRERGADGETRRLRVSASPEDGPGELLLDVADLPLDGGEAIDWLAPSPDGLLLALGVSSNGDEQPLLHLIELATGALVGAPVPHVESVAWLPDASGLYCARGRARSQEQPLRRLALLHPGEAPSWVAGAPEAAASGGLVVQLSPDGRRVGLAEPAWHPRLTHVYDRVEERWTTALADAVDQVFFGLLVDDAYVAVTDVGTSGRGRLVEAPLATLADETTWRELVPESDAVLRTVTRCGDDLLLHELSDGTPRLRFLTRDGRELATVPLPADATIVSGDRLRSEGSATTPVQSDDQRLVFTASSPGRSATLWRYDAARGALAELTRPERELPPLTVETLTCGSADGHTVRCRLVRRADAPSDAPLPTLLHGYGGFDNVQLPGGYLGLAAPWVLAGGAYAFAHLRGDGTFGTAVWRDGRRERKQNGFDDLLACAEALIAQRRTTAERLALMGASNGGLLASAALVQRPELFAAIAVLIPMTDMARLWRERFAEAHAPEYGDPAVEREARWLRAWSPYHQVRHGMPCPPTILVAGDRDMRTHAWHARKLAAALQDAADPATPILLRTHLGRGHGSTVASDPAHVAEWLGFLMAHVGLEPTG